ncbi:tryptophan-rich sensory protein [Candidatus Methanoperedens nitroreducens]|uniref:Tryptophan-rich sensory protein n=1 Tax=Candidatus Methanoperedens nitratireducens TaxID=1392998 RepID=A0A062V3P5_9EURY|nr:TspO/MBR family protein [Candidatus Methanoperedens nitroreducens]KCZ71937.1 tryptophan-rich sensory protein [Candidatus Methanoperedens nitroreducens]MDJ1422085.1 tryptophan-rich sensory protein [Candidatus Methanoperedens sp.]
MESSKVTEVTRLVVSVTICLFAGLIGSVFTAPSIPAWYTTLEKPPFTPPDWLFAPVWTALFVLMGISAFLVWRKGLNNKQVKNALGIFAIQLVLNVLWSAMFFGLRSPLAGLIGISVLWIAILATILKFSKISKVAGLLLVPYILWVSFAAVLNFFIWRLNA